MGAATFDALASLAQHFTWTQRHDSGAIERSIAAASCVVPLGVAGLLWYGLRFRER